MGCYDCDASRGQMRADQLREQSPTPLIEIRGGLIEDPEAAARRQQPREGDTATLPGREAARPTLRAVRHARALERGADLPECGAAAQARCKQQILRRGELALESILMTEIVELEPKGFRIGDYITAAPPDSATLQRDQTAQRAQQSRFAG